jgi:hypothetical protein
LEENPFVNGRGGYPLFIKQDCPLIGVGYGYIDEHRNLIGKTTDVNGVPDSDTVDIGFHYFYFDWNAANLSACWRKLAK